MSFDKIPAELQALNQWVVWRFEDQGGKKPTKVPYNPATGKKADTTNPHTWSDFAICCMGAEQKLYDGIGFVLASSDPYTFIDLDDVHGDTEAAERQLKIFQAFDSYSERSPSGAGLHIIVKGSVPTGRKRAYVEVYSDVRFMTMTGDVFHASLIQPRQELVTALWEQMGGAPVVDNYAGDATEKIADQEVINTAAAADNGEKFCNLWHGKWEQYYSSQSEADFALINIIAFYTQHKGQIVRLFRFSALGQRDKAQRDKYVNYMVSRSFDRMLPPIDMDAMKIMLDEQLKARQAVATVETPNPFIQTAPVYQATFSTDTGPFGDLKPNTTAYPVAMGLAETLQTRPVKVAKFVYEKPPGLVGDIADFVLAAAPRPVPEMALVAALSLMAGICGRAYNISGMGLNIYLLLLAPTGTGKEQIASGIDRLMAEVGKAVPACREFIGPAEIASAEALLKYMNSTSRSFVSMMGEFALKLKQMSAVNAAPHHTGLKRTLLDLFNKSGEGKVLHPIIYSDRMKNTEVVDSPAFSLMGESSPERFYETLNEGMISEGLLPRFSLVEYDGMRTPLNESHSEAKVPLHVVEKLTALCGHALTLNQANKAINVRCDADATKALTRFDKYCDKRINDGGTEVVRQLWNRAHVKALKLAALITVGNNPFDPVVSGASAEWAIRIVVNDVDCLLARFASGRVGMTDASEGSQFDDVSRAIMEYFTAPFETLAKYNVTPMLHSQRVIPHSYLARRLSNQLSFRSDRMGATNALKRCVGALLERGELQEVSPSDRASRFRTTARCYVVPNLAAFSALG